MQKFRGLRWMPLEPELLDYDNTQILLIGGGSFEKAVEGQEKDVKENENEAPAEEMEKLEDEVSFRICSIKVVSKEAETCIYRINLELNI